MRITYFTVMIILTAALGAFLIASLRSRKSIAPSLALLVGGLMPPVVGNLIIVISQNEILSTVGCYIYFLGMDFVIYALLRFTFEYCRININYKVIRNTAYFLIIADSVQLLLNLVFHHAFTTEMIIVDGGAYFRLVPLAGQTIHRIVDYGIFAAALAIFAYKMIKSPKIYFERYSIIFFSMVFSGAWETFYIFSRRPLDTSMISFGIFGILVSYFSLYYKPMRLLDRILANIIQDMTSAFFFFDDSGNCVWANSYAINLAGIENNNFETAPLLLNKIFDNIDLTSNGWTSHNTVTSDGEKRYYQLDKEAVSDGKRTVGSFLKILDETSHRREVLREKFTATHDSMTGIYTKERLFERIKEEFTAHPEKHYYIIFLDVKDFKIVNDVFGRDFGDFVICDIADSLRNNFPPGSIYGRLAGDTFGVCINAEGFNAEIAERILSNYVVNNGEFEHQIIIHEGVYDVKDLTVDVSVMFDRAHIAIDSIKNDYKRHIAFYDDDMRGQRLWDQSITIQLENAIRTRQIRPYLQPIVDSNGVTVGAEALVRWVHPEHGFLPPAKFIPVFEKNGMIADLDRFMWKCACDILTRWKAEGRDDLFISVNVSPKDFYFMDVVSTLRSTVKEYGVSPDKLRIEITETMMMTDSINKIQIIKDLKEAGFLVEIDDFGSGYSSFNMLKDMQVDVIKIDMVFLEKTNDDTRARKILRNIMNMTHDLGISSLTEGVDTEEHYQMLNDMGCKLFQGYYFSKPVSVEDFEEQYLTSE